MEEDYKSKLTLLKKKGKETPSRLSDEALSEKDVTSLPDNAISAPSSSSNYIVRWSCGECSNECLPVTLESKCLCGHRMKEHNRQDPKLLCKNPRCKCIGFYYIVAEGAWILRCECKHKHTDHDCSTPLHPCLKCGPCKEFRSPWVCNCGHLWSLHHQVVSLSCAVTRDSSSSRVIHSMRQDGFNDDL